MYCCASFVTYAEAAELVKPREGPFDDPADSAETATMIGVAFAEHTLDAHGLEGLAMGLGIVPAVAHNEIGALSRVSRLAAHGGHRFEQRQQLRDVVGVGAGYGKRQGDALRVSQDMMLGAVFAPVCRVWARFLPPKTARTEALSTTVWDQSIPSAPCKWASKTPYTLSQMPNLCQSLRRRQHVTPLPQPISRGKYDQGIPVRKTNRIPIRAWRLGTAGRPLLLGGLSGGSSAWISVHKSSGRTARAITSSLQPGCTLAPHKIHRQKMPKL